LYFCISRVGSIFAKLHFSNIVPAAQKPLPVPLLYKAIPHNSRLTPCAPSRRPLHTAGFEKMLVNPQRIHCAFLFAIGAHWLVIRHAELWVLP
jgi:hypothetical protein